MCFGICPQFQISSTTSGINLTAAKDLFERYLIILAMVLQVDLAGSGLDNVAWVRLADSFFIGCHAKVLAFEAAICFFNKSVAAWIHRTHNLTWKKCFPRHLLPEIWNAHHGSLPYALEVSVIDEQLCVFAVAGDFAAYRLLASGYHTTYRDVALLKGGKNFASRVKRWKRLKGMLTVTFLGQFWQPVLALFLAVELQSASDLRLLVT